MFHQPPLRFLPPFFKLLALFSLMLISTQISFLAAAFLVHQYFDIQDTSAFAGSIALQAEHPMASLVMQAVGTGLGAFLLPSIMFSVLAYGAIGRPLKLIYYPNFTQLMIAIGLVLASGVFVSLLVDVNKKIPIPDSLSFLKEFQQNYETLMSAYFENINLLRFGFLVLVLAVMPAIGEELFFRGAVMKILSESRLGVHGAVVFSALAFAVMHFEFYNTLAIFFMGWILGYIFYFTQSIWASIAAHFINNFTQIFLKYLFSTGVIAIDIFKVENLPLYQTISAGILSFLLLWLLWKNKSEEPDKELLFESIYPPTNHD
jgi:membrane protease YdiL (CAAX protease family)